MTHNNQSGNQRRGPRRDDRASSNRPDSRRDGQRPGPSSGNAPQGSSSQVNERNDRPRRDHEHPRRGGGPPRRDHRGGRDTEGSHHRGRRGGRRHGMRHGDQQTRNHRRPDAPGSQRTQKPRKERDLRPITIRELPGELTRPEQRHQTPTFHRYGVVFYDNLEAAKADLQNLGDQAKHYDHLNIVIRAEANMDDPDLTRVGRVFAGAAWALIHDRRVADGWYEKPQEFVPTGASKPQN